MPVRFDADFTLTINGNGVAGASSFDVVNPADETVVAQAPDCSADQLDDAVAAARGAFPAWSARPVADRGRFLLEMAAAIDAHVEPLRWLLTAEQGKTLADAGTEISGAAYWLRETAELTLPEVVNEDSDVRRSTTHHVPLGVVGAIAPWNFPLGLAAFKLGPALLAGNTVVLKPSPFTPLMTLKVGELLRGVLPAGVLNVVSGGDELGPWMTAHPGIDKIAFTGSTQTGRKVMAGAAASLKRVTLELGGNDPAIVLPDVDVPSVAEKLFWGAFGNTGQVCLAAKRVYIHADVYEPLKNALVAIARSVTVGDGRAAGVQLGPIQNRPQYELVLDLIRDAQAEGHDFLTGGLPDEQKGYFVPLTIIDNPPEESRIVQEEQFGPVLPLLRYDDVEDAITRANAGEYGLGASVWSADPDRALAVGQRLQAGTVWINEIQHLTPSVTFAGHKQSGVGTENGLEGLLEYTVPRTITVRRNQEVG
jgi:acyl-CoA reductase-like NAD-dependent aldehyde dehydrogenase